MERNNILEKIMKARVQRYLNNCYSMDIVDRCTELWSLSDEFIFTYEDHGIERIAFFANGWHNIDKLLELVDHKICYIEFMTKDPKEYIPADATLTACMMRLANPDCRTVFSDPSPILQFRDPTIGEKADQTQIRQINGILWSTFHTEVSHLMYDDEMASLIDQFTIHKQGDQIDAILQADIMPKKFYINQVVNQGEKKNIHAMLLNRLEEYINKGGKYMYAWVEDKNIASQKFHAKYGMWHDGMWNMVYRLERA
jgi:hypothetical protein